MPAPPPFPPRATCSCMRARCRSCRFREVHRGSMQSNRADTVIPAERAGLRPGEREPESSNQSGSRIHAGRGLLGPYADRPPLRRGDACVALLGLRIASPLEMASRHVGPIAHAKEERAGGAVAVFMQLARWMYHERARHHVDRLARGAHLSAALEAEINFGGVRMAVIGTDLARLPARHGDVTLSNLPEDLLHVVLGIPLLLFSQIEPLHPLPPQPGGGATP